MSTASPVRSDLKCPQCATSMVLVHMMAKFLALPETYRNRCPECHGVVEEEIDQDGDPLSSMNSLAEDPSRSRLAKQRHLDDSHTSRRCK
jgi:hypothetical protein